MAGCARSVAGLLRLDIRQNKSELAKELSVADTATAMRYFESGPTQSRDGGIGRRSRLKIVLPQI